MIIVSIDKLMVAEDDNIPELAKSLDKDDISQLVDLLSLKDDKVRYKALRLLLNRSSFYGDVYPYWDIFQDKLKSGNSYQRSIGVMMIAENVKWDNENKFDKTAGDYWKVLNDEKPITIRQCIQALSRVIPYYDNIIIAEKLMSINLFDIKETMRKVILLDILNILAQINKQKTSDEIENYFAKALSGEILDKKSKKQVELSLQ